MGGFITPYRKVHMHIVISTIFQVPQGPSLFKYWIEKPEKFLRVGNSYSSSITQHILLQITQHTSTIHLHDSIIS